MLLARRVVGGLDWAQGLLAGTCSTVVANLYVMSSRTRAVVATFRFDGWEQALLFINAWGPQGSPDKGFITDHYHDRPCIFIIFPP